jgi:hypothetical protein
MTVAAAARTVRVLELAAFEPAAKQEVLRPSAFYGFSLRTITRS